MTNTPGFVLLSRDILSKSVWDGDPQILKLWLYCLLNANYSPHTYMYQGIEIPRGHLINSYRAIASECSYTLQNRQVTWSPAKVERMLSVLVSDGRIRTTHHGNAGTLIEVLNWSARQSGDSFQKSATPVPKKKTDHSRELWEVWLDELSPSPPHPALTRRRAKILEALYVEQLSANGSDPLVLFRKVLRAVKGSAHHMSTRAYQLPESLFRNEERRESWTHRALAKSQADPKTSTVDRDWSVDQ